MDEWINNSNGFLLIFAINDKESLNFLKSKIQRIKKNKKGEIPCIIVGNKCDLEDKRVVNKQEGMDLAKSLGKEYYETSALTDKNGNVKVIFQKCAQLIIGKYNSDSKEGKCLCNIF